MRRQIVAIAVLAVIGGAAIAAALVMTQPATVTVAESITVSFPDSSFDLVPNSTVSKFATVSNSSGQDVNVVVGVDDTDLAPVGVLGVIVPTGAIIIPAGGDVQIEVNMLATNGALPGTYTVNLTFVRP